MRRPRGLLPEEAALWRKVASTVKPLDPARLAQAQPPQAGEASPAPVASPPQRQPARAVPRAAGTPASRIPVPQPARSLDSHGLDAGWDRKLARGLIDPDFTLDLHGATLDMAYARLGHGLNQARTMGARVVLLITGRPRPVDAADRGRMRGAIRAKIGDWIAAGEHGTAIAAIRPAHRRHGGPGTLYLVLRRRRG